MRRKDIFALIGLWGLLLAGLAWALATQARWVQENKPIQAKPPALFRDEPSSPEAVPGTRVIGPITDDTREAMRQGLRPPARRSEGSRQAVTPPESHRRGARAGAE